MVAACPLSTTGPFIAGRVAANKHQFDEGSAHYRITASFGKQAMVPAGEAWWGQGWVGVEE